MRLHGCVFLRAVVNIHQQLGSMTGTTDGCSMAAFALCCVNAVSCAASSSAVSHCFRISTVFACGAIC